MNHVRHSTRTLMYGALKFKVGSVVLFCDLSPTVLSFIASKSLKLSFTLNCVLERVNDLKTTLLSRCVVEVRQKFEAVPRE